MYWAGLCCITLSFSTQLISSNSPTIWLSGKFTVSATHPPYRCSELPGDIDLFFLLLVSSRSLMLCFRYTKTHVFPSYRLGSWVIIHKCPPPIQKIPNDISLLMQLVYIGTLCPAFWLYCADSGCLCTFPPHSLTFCRDTAGSLTDWVTWKCSAL